MGSLKETRRRIQSVKNTQKITYAMKLVSAAKFARANTAVKNARPYGSALDNLVQQVIAAEEEEKLSLLQDREEKKSVLLLVGTDRGLCGSLNNGVFKTASNLLKEKTKEGVKIEVISWGNRATLFTRKAGLVLRENQEKVLEKIKYERASQTAKMLIRGYIKEEFDRVYICYARFESALSQKPTLETLLPIKQALLSQETYKESSQVILEPSMQEMLPALMERFVASRIHRSMLEAAASEHGARMTAMDSATSNAKEVIKKLSIEYNRARQAAITKELIEITSGAEVL